MQSHPAWVRGLKLLRLNLSPSLFSSHPAWVRGLKQRVEMHCTHHHAVAPRVGAWIETSPSQPLTEPIFVAPRVGAWIETAC